MTNETAKKILQAKLECIKRFTSGNDLYCNRSDCDNCYLNYDQGNFGEQQEALKVAIKILQQEDPDKEDP